MSTLCETGSKRLSVSGHHEIESSNAVTEHTFLFRLRVF